MNDEAITRREIYNECSGGGTQMAVPADESAGLGWMHCPVCNKALKLRNVKNHTVRIPRHRKEDRVFRRTFR